MLQNLVGDDPQTVRELLFDYRASARKVAATLRAAFAAADVRQVGAIAHQLKSSSRSVGAMDLGDLCAELENASLTQGRDSVQQCIVRFDAELIAVDEQLGQLLARS